MNDYKNPIVDYDPKAISAWQVADKLKVALDGAEGLVYWNMEGEGFGSGYIKGYRLLVEEIKEAIPALKKIY